MKDYLVIALVCGLISYIIVPFTIKIAYHVKAVSVPHSRHVHTKPMPLLGGLAIFLAFIFGFMIFSTPEIYTQRTIMNEIPAILISGILILLLGTIDDIKPLRAFTKLAVQFAVALVIIFYGKLRIDGIFDFLPPVIDSTLSILLTLFWLISVINAINIVDGLNGLSAGVSVIYFSTVLAVYFFGGFATPFALLLASLMLGSTLGYLPWNFPKAKVFMGDTGSMFLGLMIAIIPLLGFKQVTLISLFLPMIMMIVPVYEIISTVLRRRLNNRSLGEADDDHIHHQLLRATKSPVKAVMIIWLISILFSITSIIFEVGSFALGMTMFIALSVVSIGLLQFSKEFNNYESTARKLVKRVKEKRNDRK